MKNYQWSNGTPVTAQNVLFWIHMLQAVGQTEWGAFTPGGFPANITGVKATSATTLTMTMNKAYSPAWFTYNELSQINPMPKAWDRTVSGPSDCTDNVPTARPSSATSTASPRPCRAGRAPRYGASWTGRSS